MAVSKTASAPYSSSGEQRQRQQQHALLVATVVATNDATTSIPTANGVNNACVHNSNRPRSPWRRLLLVRSMSFDGGGGESTRTASASSPRERKQRDYSRHKRQKRQQESKQQPQRQQRQQQSRPLFSSSSSSSSWGWLLTPPTRFVSNPLERLSPGSRSSRHRQSLFSSSSRGGSNLTIFLLKLDECLPTFCQILTTGASSTTDDLGSLTQCQEAAALLDDVKFSCSATTPPSSTSPRQRSFFHSDMSRNPATATAATTTTTTTAVEPLLLEGEWETYVSPLLLLTGAEALYGQMNAVTICRGGGTGTATDSANDARLARLYRTIQADLRVVKERLCDPWLLARTTSPAAATTTTSGSGNKVHKFDDNNDTTEDEKAHSTSNPTTARTATANQAAERLAKALDSLQTFLDIRCQLVEMQTQLLFGKQQQQQQTQREPFAIRATVLLESCRNMLVPLTTNNSNDGSDGDDEAVLCSRYGRAVVPLMSAVVKECKTWIALLETASHLEQCRFTETVLSARKLRLLVNPTSHCVLQLWFRHMLEQFLYIMPMYFDRITAFASPLYGFDTMALMHSPSVHSDQQQQAANSYDSIVLDFLRKHEGKGGPSMAVGIVIDAVSTSNLNFGRGFVVKQLREQQAAEAINKELTQAQVERKEWQAVYMRSNVHHSAAASASSSSSPSSRSPSYAGGREHSSSMSTIIRRSRGSSFRKKSVPSTNEQDFSLSLANIVRNVSHDNSTTSTQVHPSHNVMEYPPDTGPVSWPYTEWRLLVELVKNEFPSSSEEDGFSSVHAVTYRQPEPKEQTARATKPTLSLATTLGQAPLAPPPLVPSPPTKPSTNSSFHLVRLSDYITMVAIVKCEDDGKWHLRRTRGHSDEEIRVFLNEMALKLKVSILLDTVETFKKSIGTAEGQHQQSSSSTATAEHNLVKVWRHWDDEAANDDTQDFLRELKRAFQLRPQSPYMESLHTPCSTHRANRKKKRGLTYSESAAAFFLGPDIHLP